VRIAVRSQFVSEPGERITVLVGQPKQPLSALTTYELRDYRRQPQNAIAFFDSRDPVAAVRDDLQARLDDVLAEQDDRDEAGRPRVTTKCAG